ncbi:MAG: hypothetical protein NWE92_13345 [Candidatus Bathyarchaeota archaeon]|nr:hypothetical protein [Candidatus Bathyarchaeota archaeon]
MSNPLKNKPVTSPRTTNHSLNPLKLGKQVKASAPPRDFSVKSAAPREENPPQKEDKTEKSAAPRTSQKYWDQIDDLFYRTIKHAEDAFKINVALNVVVAAVGVTLLGYSIGYSWLKGLDVYSTAFGTLGVASFVALFFFSPQRKIQRTTGDLTQIQMLYRTYSMQVEEVNDWYYRHPEKTKEDIQAMNKHLDDITQKALDKIEKYIGEAENSTSPTDNGKKT